MTYSYQYIRDLFTAIFENSKNIAGRFYISHRYGAQEINSDSLGELVAEIVNKKYPLALLTPPTSRLSYPATDWEIYKIVIFFMTTSFYGDGKNLNYNTRTGTHTVIQDWQDMKRCAKGFIKQLQSLEKTTQGKIFRIPPREIYINPVSIISQDRVSGIRLDFDFTLYTNLCEPVEDYNNLITTMPILTDSHPEHKI